MKKLNVQELLTKGYEILKDKHIESYMLDCQLILCKVLNLDKMAILLNRNMEISEEKAKLYFSLVNKRKERMPLKYLTEQCEFMGIDFFVKEGVLIPRPDTEVLVEEVLRIVEEKGFKKICDVCCGSGAIGLSIAKLVGNSEVYCYDIDDTALEVTAKNIKKLSLERKAKVIKSDLLSNAIEGKFFFDVVVSNPPYIRTDVIPMLMEDVKDYEPYIALCGGEDGLDFYRKITEQSLKVLKPGGILAYEIGYDQSEAVQGILLDNGYTKVKYMKDLAGLDRVVVGVKG